MHAGAEQQDISSWKGCRLVELGSGVGLLAIFLAKLGAQVIFLALSEGPGKVSNSQQKDMVPTKIDPRNKVPVKVSAKVLCHSLLVECTGFEPPRDGYM